MPLGACKVSPRRLDLSELISKHREQPLRRIVQLSRSLSEEQQRHLCDNMTEDAPRAPVSFMQTLCKVSESRVFSIKVGALSRT